MFSKHRVPRKTDMSADQSRDEKSSASPLDESPVSLNQPLTQDSLLQLQRLIGNRATANLLARPKTHRSGAIAQAKNTSSTLQREPVDLDKTYAKSNADTSYFADFKRIQALLKNRAAIHKHLMLIEAELKLNKKLSKILGSYAAQCGISKRSPTLIGFVSAKRFLAMIRRGESFKDYGAPPGHGEFTHQLQWFVIMSEITDQFKVPKTDGWDHTPLELYVATGDEQYGADGKYMWDYLVDRLYAETSYKWDEEGYSSPDAMIADLTAEKPWLLASVAPTENQLTELRGALTKRKAKRDVAREHGGKGSGEAAVHALLYTRKKKAQFPNFEVEGTDDEKLIEIFYKDKVASELSLEERLKQSEEKLLSATENSPPSPTKTDGVVKDRQQLLIQEIQAQTNAIIDDLFSNLFPSDSKEEENPLPKDKFEVLVSQLKEEFKTVENGEKDIHEFYPIMEKRKDIILERWGDEMANITEQMEENKKD